jgi:hypothetical protein
MNRTVAGNSLKIAEGRLLEISGSASKFAVKPIVEVKDLL